MFRDILEGKESSKIVLIRDSTQQCGRSVLKAFLSNLATRVDRIHLIVYDLGTKEYMKGFHEDTRAKICCHDGVDDPLGWLSTSPNSLRMTENLLHYLQSHAKKEDCRIAIVIDSISQLLLHSSCPYTCSTLHQLVSQPLYAGCETVQLLALVHEDLHDDLVLAQLQHIASTILTVSSARTKEYHSVCELLHARTSGKIFRTKEHLLLGQQFNLEETEEIRGLLDLPILENSTADPTANLTFRLSLKDNEKEARSQLQLPYMHQERKASPLNTSAAPSGKIFYQPDKDDDFDEEDPDDDLDI